MDYPDSSCNLPKKTNLDPRLKATDESIWTALRQVQLDKFVKSLEGQLDHNLDKSGDNLSTGQNQLFCLARALLKRTGILLIDEATANVDPFTDKLVQKTIRCEFTNQTVITIAHRLETIIDYDRIFVMANGNLIESGKPLELILDKQSHFFTLC